MTLCYDVLEPAWADRAVDWLASRGVHAYLVADDWELAAIERRLAGSRVAQALRRPARAVVGDPPAVFLYDVTSPADPAITPERVSIAGAGAHAVEPSPPPSLVFPRMERNGTQ